MNAMDDAVLTALAGEVLAPDVVDDVVARALAALRPTSADDTRRALERERRKVETEASRLSEAIALGGALPPLLEQLTARQTRLEAIAARLRQLAEPVAVDPPTLGEVHPRGARQLAGSLTATDDSRPRSAPPGTDGADQFHARREW